MRNATTAALTRRTGMYPLIRQLHLWIGAWGAIAAIGFGFTGFIQNHRAILKLPQGETTELSKVEIEVPAAARATPDALHDWLRDVRHVPIDSVKTQSGAPGQGGGKREHQGERWLLSGGNPRVSWAAEYTPGNATVQVRNSRQSPLAMMSRLHKGVGGGVAWILLGDSFALALVLLGLSGIVMWARGRSLREMVLSVLGVATAVIALVLGSAFL